MSERPFSIKIFLPHGQPDGLRIVDKSNWTGCGIVFPLSLFPDIKKREGEQFGSGMQSCKLVLNNRSATWKRKNLPSKETLISPRHSETPPAGDEH